MPIYQLEPGQRGTSNGQGDAKRLIIGHINARGLKSDKKIERLENMMIQYKFDVFGITETHYSDHTRAPNMTGYQRAVLECRQKCGKKPVWGGVAVYVKKGVNYILMDSRTYSYDNAFADCMGPENEHPIQYIHIKVTKIYERTIPHMHVVIIYVPPKAVDKLTALVHFLQHKMRGHSSVVVLGDVNENAFQSSPIHIKKVKESGFGQIIREVTRPASGTLLDHIYVKAFPFTKSLKMNVENMVQQSGVVQTRQTIGDHDLIFCVVTESYLNRNYENPRAAFDTLLKCMGVAEQQARDDLQIFAIRLIQHLIEEAKIKTKKFRKILERTAVSLCRGLSIDAYAATEYHNSMRDKWPTQFKRIHIRCGGKDVICRKDVICLENKSSNELELETNDLGRFLYLCIFSGAHKLKLQTMTLDIIDTSSLVDRQWSLQLQEAADKITNSTSRGLGKVRYTVPKSANHQNYHAYVDSLVSELDVSLTIGERGARLHANCSKGKILFSAGTKYELTSSLYKIIAVLHQLKPDVLSTSWQFYGQPAVREYVCLKKVKSEIADNMKLPYKNI